MLCSLKNLFKRKHKHKWLSYLFYNKEHAMIWYVRRCECGVKEILHAGGTGDGKWHTLDENHKFKFDWEEEWFKAAKIMKGVEI